MFFYDRDKFRSCLYAERSGKSRYDRYRYDDRIKIVSRHAQAHAKRSYDKGELSYLRKREAAFEALSRVWPDNSIPREENMSLPNIVTAVITIIGAAYSTRV